MQTAAIRKATVDDASGIASSTRALMAGRLYWYMPNSSLLDGLDTGKTNEYTAWNLTKDPDKISFISRRYIRQHRRGALALGSSRNRRC